MSHGPNFFSEVSFITWLESIVVEVLKGEHTNGQQAQLTSRALSKRKATGILHEVSPRCVILDIFINDKEWNREHIYFVANDAKAERRYKHFGRQD